MRLTPWFVLMGLLCILIADFRLINDHALGGDASQNLRSALNLLQHGIYGEAELGDTVLPGFRREPAPNFLLSFYLGCLPTFVSGFDYLSFAKDPTLVMISKWINLGYVAALLSSIWLLVRRLVTPSVMADSVALLLFCLVNYYFIKGQLNNLNTELPASICFVWLSLALVLADQSSSSIWIWIWISGISFGLLTLTKASAAYIGLFTIPMLALCLAWKVKRLIRVLTLFSLGFALVVLPWVARNQIEFERPVIAQGGGDVLLIRSVFNTMSDLEFLHAFYSYAPKAIRDDLLGPSLDLTQDDRECGGHLDRFNRGLVCDQLALKEERFEDVRSFYQIGKRALPRSLGLTREQKRGEAMNRILATPQRHLMISLPLAWRGVWSFEKVSQWGGVLLNLMSFVALFLAPLFGLLQQKPTWLYLSLAPASYFLFYAGFSHFLPRYSEPLIPLALVCLFLIAIQLIGKLFPASRICLRF